MPKDKKYRDIDSDKDFDEAVPQNASGKHDPLDNHGSMKQPAYDGVDTDFATDEEEARRLVRDDTGVNEDRAYHGKEDAGGNE